MPRSYKKHHHTTPHSVLRVRPTNLHLVIISRSSGMEEHQRHFLVVAYPAQGHINPSLRLARRLARTTGALVTFSTAVSAHRRMFPSAPDPEVDDGVVTHIPFSNGYDGGVTPGTVDSTLYMSRFRQVSSTTLSTILDSLPARGRPVTCIIYNLVMPWVADAARERGITSALFWIQPATVFAIYYHCFHGYDSLVAAHCDDPSFTVTLPALPPLRIRDLPSFLTTTDPDDPYSAILATLREIFEGLDRVENRPRVLVNTFDSLEADALAAVEELKPVPIGPLVPSSLINGEDAMKDGAGGDLFKGDGKGYMEWLDTKAERSVVYVSFGTMSALKKRQVEEIARGLAESGRPYLWTIRKDEGCEGVELELELEEGGEMGMVVEWCSQTRVLSHPAVGCFVTHCGWNSTLETVTCGVPTVGVPQWTDQTTIARMAEEAWGTGVRAVVDEEGVMDSKELKRCLELVMGKGERGVEIRRSARKWADAAREAVKEGGSSDRNLKAFLLQANTINHLYVESGISKSCCS